MIWAIDACLAEFRDQINNEFIKDGKPMPEGTPLVDALVKRMPGKIGRGYYRVGKRVDLIERPLYQVTVYLRVSNSERFEYKVESAHPSDPEIRS